MVDAWTSTHPKEDGLTFNMLDVKPAADRAAANKATAEKAMQKKKAAAAAAAESNDDDDDDDDDDNDYQYEDEEEEEEEEEEETEEEEEKEEKEEEEDDVYYLELDSVPLSERGLKKRIDYIIMKAWSGVKLDEVATIPRAYQPDDPPASDHLGLIMQLSREKE